jgi:hypothetical protein
MSTLLTDESSVLVCRHRSEVEPQDAVRAADSEFGILRGHAGDGKRSPETLARRLPLLRVALPSWAE